jgi:hypothetical protein
VPLTPAANLLQVPYRWQFATGVVDTGGKFAIGVDDTGGNLPPVSLIPVEHLHLRISPRIFKKILKDPKVIFTGLGEDDS